MSKFFLKISAAVTLVLVGAGIPVAALEDPAESPDGPEAVKVYYSEEQALNKVFTQADTLWVDTWTMSPGEKDELEARLGWKVTEESFDIHRAFGNGRDLGYAVITEEQGRFKPITFIVKLSDSQQVDLVLVMVYRESRGDGVKRQRFLKQFQDKDAADHLRLNRDIAAVSGATMSSRALAAGVRKVLAVVALKYPAAEAGP